jgi:hypothetical protein
MFLSSILAIHPTTYALHRPARDRYDSTDYPLGAGVKRRICVEWRIAGSTTGYLRPLDAIRGIILNPEFEPPTGLEHGKVAAAAQLSPVSPANRNTV